jgi:hypothetical protein
LKEEGYAGSIHQTGPRTRRCKHCITMRHHHSCHMVNEQRGGNL